jgi:hypothetical protein
MDYTLSIQPISWFLNTRFNKPKEETIIECAIQASDIGTHLKKDVLIVWVVVDSISISALQSVFLSMGSIFIGVDNCVLYADYSSHCDIT